jgi:hypothetical protein
VRAEPIDALEFTIASTRTVQRAQEPARVLGRSKQVGGFLKCGEIGLRDDHYRLSVLSLNLEWLVVLADRVQSLFEITAESRIGG